MNTYKKLEKIVNHYGLYHQVRKFNEETYEACEAILLNDDKEHIEEEIADVWVVVNQLIIYLNLDNERINRKVYEKIDRQLRRMEVGE